MELVGMALLGSVQPTNGRLRVHVRQSLIHSYHVQLYNSANYIQASFDVEGIKEAIQPIQKSCRKL